eukprot:m.272287 g.272287  ORF g.272287 m.272287 type:complete len:848 (+) comp19330_c0_seq1:56-2599(+)
MPVSPRRAGVATDGGRQGCGKTVWRWLRGQSLPLWMLGLCLFVAWHQLMWMTVFPQAAGSFRPANPLGVRPPAVHPDYGGGGGGASLDVAAQPQHGDHSKHPNSHHHDDGDEHGRNALPARDLPFADLPMENAEQLEAEAAKAAVDANKAAAAAAADLPGDTAEKTGLRASSVFVCHNSWCLDRFGDDDVRVHGFQGKSDNQRWVLSNHGLVSVVDGKCLQVLEDHSLPKGTSKVRVAACTSDRDASNVFNYSPLTQALQRVSDARCLEAEKVETKPALLRACTSSTQQQWTLYPEAAVGGNNHLVVHKKHLQAAAAAGSTKHIHGPKVHLRHLTRCMHSANGVVITMHHPHKWTAVQWVFGEGGELLASDRKCLSLQPGTRRLVTAPCVAGDSGQRWEWTDTYYLRHSETGYCVSAGDHVDTQLEVQPCDSGAETQLWAVVNVTLSAAEIALDPDAAIGHKIHAAATADEKVAIAKANVQQIALETDAEAEARLKTPIHTHRRRAAVTYQDMTSMEQLQWFLFGWHSTGLDSAEAALDIVIFVAPGAVPFLPSECKPVPEDQSQLPMQGPIPGRCLYVPLLPLNTRDPVYTEYYVINSLQCMYDAHKSGLLLRYRLLLRTDMDTFLTPRFHDWWPETFQVRDKQGYDYKDVPKALADAAVDLGLRHTGHTGLSSTWYGPSQQVVHMSRLTVAVGRYAIYKFFSKSLCHLPEAKRPAGTKCWNFYDASWGETLYEGVVLLYAQELAVNHVVGKALSPSRVHILDHGATSTKPTCSTYHIHVYHSPDRFNKWSMGQGEYDDFDLDTLDLRVVRDYATYIALRGSGRGHNGDGALARVGGSLRNVCKRL